VKSYRSIIKGLSIIVLGTSIACSEQESDRRKLEAKGQALEKAMKDIQGLWEVKKMTGVTEENDPLMGSKHLGASSTAATIQFEFAEDQLTIVHNDGDITFLNVSTKIKMDGSTITTVDNEDQKLPDFSYKLEKDKLILTSNGLLSSRSNQNGKHSVVPALNKSDSSSPAIPEDSPRKANDSAAKAIVWELTKIDVSKKLKLSETKTQLQMELKSAGSVIASETTAPSHNHSVRLDNPAVRCVLRKEGNKNRLFFRYVSPKIANNPTRQVLRFQGDVDFNFNSENEDKHFYIKVDGQRTKSIGAIFEGRTRKSIQIEGKEHCTVQLKRTKKLIEFDLSCTKLTLTKARPTSAQHQKEVARIASRTADREQEAQSNSLAEELLKEGEVTDGTSTPLELSKAQGRCYLQMGSL